MCIFPVQNKFFCLFSELKYLCSLDGFSEIASQAGEGKPYTEGHQHSGGEEGSSEVQVHHQLHNEVEANLGYLRLCLDQAKPIKQIKLCGDTCQDQVSEVPADIPTARLGASLPSDML